LVVPFIIANVFFVNVRYDLCFTEKNRIIRYANVKNTEQEKTFLTILLVGQNNKISKLVMIQKEVRGRKCIKRIYISNIAKKSQTS